jgi:hypothetical protein
MLSSFFMLDGSSPLIISWKQDSIEPHFSEYARGGKSP